MFIAALVTIGKKWNQPKSHSTNEYIKQKIMEHCLARKRNEMLINITTQMNLENIMLSETSQKQKATFHLCDMSRQGKFTVTENTLGVYRGCGGRKNSDCKWVSLRSDENVLELDNGDSCITL